MEKQDKLIHKILSLMYDAGILENVLLIGSWCTSFYKQYFKKEEYEPIIKTRDIDFLVGIKPRFPRNIDLEELLKPLGFEIEFFGKGYMKLESEELIIEFLIPEIGRPTEKPYLIPELKFNAQPLRHLSILWRNPINVKVSDFFIRLPHPVDFLLQKLIIASKRTKKDKAEKDRQSALAILDAIISKNELSELIKGIDNLTKKENQIVVKELEVAGHRELIKIIEKPSGIIK